jgi:GNAT superfamily N-acetyltransferase
MRPIRPDDAEALVEFHNRLSEHSVYRRYFSLHPVLSAAEVEHLTTVDYDSRMAFIVVDEGGIEAVARYDRYPGTTRAEVAFLVSDDRQHQGLGATLLEALVEVARRRGIDTFCAETQADNRSMLGLFSASGYAVARTLDDGVVFLTFAIGEGA